MSAATSGALSNRLRLKSMNSAVGPLTRLSPSRVRAIERIERAVSWAAGLSGSSAGVAWTSARPSPSGCGSDTASTPGSRAISSRTRRASCSGTVAVTGESRFGVNSASTVSVTVRASRPSGTDWLPGWTRVARTSGNAGRSEHERDPERNRNRTPHDGLGEPEPTPGARRRWRRAAQAQRVHPLAEEREHGGYREQRGRRGQKRDHAAAPAPIEYRKRCGSTIIAADRRGHRQSAEEDRAARGLDRAPGAHPTPGRSARAPRGSATRAGGRSPPPGPGRERS